MERKLILMLSYILFLLNFTPYLSFAENENKNETLKCKVETPLRIQVINNEVVCKDVSNKEIVKSKNFISIQNAAQKETITPKSGILLKGVVAGRGFHWQKEVDLYFSHKLEFYNWNSKL